MFLRRAGTRFKKLSFQCHAQDIDALQLPFLCPALYKCAQVRKTSTHVQRAAQSTKQAHRTGSCSKQDFTPSQNRGLASAAPAEVFPSPGEHVPWAGNPNLSPQADPRLGPALIPPMHGMDSQHSPLILNATPTTLPRHFRFWNGEIGDPNEIHQTLHACLQVGRLPRAAALVRRLQKMYKPDAPGLLAAHKDYISELSLRVVRRQDPMILQELVRWFEVEVRQKSVSLDGPILTLMIQACLSIPESRQVPRALRRYYRMAQEWKVEAEVEKLLPQLRQVLKDNDATKQSSMDNENEFDDRGAQSIHSDLPLLKEVELKGLGLKSLKRSLSSLDVQRSDLEQTISEDNFNAVLSKKQRQMLLERDTADAALERWKADNHNLKRLGIFSNFANESLDSIMWQWYKDLLPAVRLEIEGAVATEDKDNRSLDDQERLRWGPYLLSISPEKVSAITIQSVLKSLAARSDKSVGATLSDVLQTLSKRLEEHYYATVAGKDQQSKEWRKLVSKHSRAQKSYHKSVYSKISMDNETNLREADKWPLIVSFKLSAMLLSKLMQIARVEGSYKDPDGVEIKEMRPAFFHTFAFGNGKRRGVLRLNDKVQKILDQSPLAVTIAKFLPMLCEPKPWTDFREGGFLSYRGMAIKYPTRDSFTSAYGTTAARNGDMQQVFAGLNALGKTSWNINRAVLEVMSQAWNAGDSVANIPIEKPIAEFPEEPLGDPKARRLWYMKVVDIDNHLTGLKTQRAFMNFQLEIARTFANETFYFPHSVDFRGRAYPMPPIFNHMGADHCRALLLFAEGKQLGSRGLWWLKIHVANVFGYDKASFKERVAFTEDHYDDITDSATNALHGRRWWLNAADPWQCLAACIELHSAMQHSDPTEYISHLAVQQDGTCNGLQHYAALGGDMIGAQQVNLEPGDRPADLYTAVAEMVQAEVHRDALDDHPLARAMDGKITRKVVKQTVMTNVYGVTFLGATRQVNKQLEDIFRIGPEGRSVELKALSRYVAKKIFAALADAFSGSRKIQQWFVESGNRICMSISPDQMNELERSISAGSDDSPYVSIPGKKKTSPALNFISPIIWTTPLGMPVVQPYRQRRVIEFETAVQELALKTYDGTNPVDKRKQIAGFPPNFIHSLDGTHMFLTANRCNELGVAFAMVHDSFWTHASDVDTLNRVNRDAFIRMHSEDVIGRLSAEFKTRYSGFLRRSKITTSRRVRMEIRQWRTKNTVKASRSEPAMGTDPGIAELLLERQRVQLLSSSDPQQREEGQAMVTPASIAASYPPEEVIDQRDGPAPVVQLGQVGATKRDKPADKLDAMKLKEPEDALSGPDLIPEQGVADETVSAAGEDGRMNKSADEDDPGKAMPKSSGGGLWIWKPLEFPPVPEKGEFDITRLRRSLYFFS